MHDSLASSYFLSPGGLAGLSTWKKPPSKTTVSFGWTSVWGCGSREFGLGLSSMLPASFAAFSAACCLAFMAAFTAARRDLAAVVAPVGLAGAAEGFCQMERTGTMSVYQNQKQEQCI